MATNQRIQIPPFVQYMNVLNQINTYNRQIDRSIEIQTIQQELINLRNDLITMHEQVQGNIALPAGHLPANMAITGRVNHFLQNVNALQGNLAPAERAAAQQAIQQVQQLIPNNAANQPAANMIPIIQQAMPILETAFQNAQQQIQYPTVQQINNVNNAFNNLPAGVAVPLGPLPPTQQDRNVVVGNEANLAQAYQQGFRNGMRIVAPYVPPRIRQPRGPIPALPNGNGQNPGNNNGQNNNGQNNNGQNNNRQNNARGRGMGM